MATKQSWLSRIFGGGKGPGDAGSAALKEWSAGQAILDDFVVERELGAGGMGKVYLLRSRSTGQPFAVKRALLRNEDSRRNILAELQTWIDLPEHPHLVACRFFRTVGDEIAIFAEFVQRGSLATLLQQRRLWSLEQELDAAIQKDEKTGKPVYLTGDVHKVRWAGEFERSALRLGQPAQGKG